MLHLTQAWQAGSCGWGAHSAWILRMWLQSELFLQTAANKAGAY